MVPLCDRLKDWYEREHRSTLDVLHIKDYVVKLYGKDEFDYKVFALPDFSIPEESFLNFIIEDNSGNLFGINHVEMHGKNIGEINGIWEENGKLYAYHVRGFTSYFDPEKNFELIEQIFTK